MQNIAMNRERGLGGFAPDIKAVMAVVVLGLACAGPSFATTFQCSFKVRRNIRDVIPADLVLKWPSFLRPAIVTGTITRAQGFGKIRTALPVETANKIVFTWSLPEFEAKGFSRIMDAPVERASAVDFRLAVYTKTGKAVLTGRPMIHKAWIINTARVEGHCKVGK
jgi:hypothetical protein